MASKFTSAAPNPASPLEARDNLQVEKPGPLRPLEFMPSPGPELSGERGANRAPEGSARIDATTDLQALDAFLGEFEHSAHTQRAYRKECEQLFLWSWRECHKAVSSLNRQDFESYLVFLADPQPANVWVGPKKRREDPAWRPFTGPLQPRSIERSLAALNSMLAYWVDSGYVLGNPLGLIRQRKRVAAQVASIDATPSLDVERHLDEDMWKALVSALEALPRETAEERASYERMRFFLALLYYLAPRVGELEQHTMGSFRLQHGRWWWNVLGKGGKLARVPLPNGFLEDLARYRGFLGLTAMPDPKDKTPLLTRAQAGALGITARRFNQLLKALCLQAVEHLDPSVQYKRERLLQVSAHWGRHTSITARVRAGMDARYVQLDARHADPRTTGLYTHEEDEARHAEAQKLGNPWGGPERT